MMKIHRWMVFAVVVVAAGLGLRAWQFRDTTDNRDEALGVTLTDPKLVEANLLEAGLPPELATLFSTITTEVVSSGSGRAHLVHQIPALGLRQEVFIAIQPDYQLDIEGLRGLPIGAGTLAYPLHHSLREVPRGYERHVVAFLPYDSIDPSALQQLGLPRRAERRREWNILPVAHAQSGLLGIVIASMTTTTSSGLGDTAPPGLGDTVPRSAPADPLPPAPPAARAPQVVVVQAPEQWGDGSAGPTSEQIREWREYSRGRPPEREFVTPEQSAEMRRNGERFRAEQSQRVNAEYERIQRHFEEAGRREAAARRAQSQSRQVGACGGSGARAASNAVPNLLHALGAATVVAEARSQFQSTAADQASGSQLIDAYERAFQGETGNPTADALARRALTEDPFGTQQTAARIAEARGDLAINTAVRGVNTAVGSAAVLLAGPASQIAAALAGLANAVGDALLRDAHNASLSGLERSNGDLTQRAQEVIRNAQDRSPTEELNYTPAEQQNYTPGPERQPDSSTCRERWTGISVYSVPDGPTITADLTWELSETHNLLVSYKPAGVLTYKAPATQSGCRVISVTPHTHQVSPEDAFLTIDVQSLEYSTSGASGWPATQCIQCSFDRQPRCEATMIGGLWLQGSGLASKNGTRLTIKENAPFVGGTLSYTFER